MLAGTSIIKPLTPQSTDASTSCFGKAQAEFLQIGDIACDGQSAFEACTVDCNIISTLKSTGNTDIELLVDQWLDLWWNPLGGFPEHPSVIDWATFLQDQNNSIAAYWFNSSMPSSITGNASQLMEACIDY